MSSSKKSNLESDFAAAIFLPEAHSSPRIHPPLPPLNTVTYMYLYLFTQGSGGVLNQVEGKRGIRKEKVQITKLGQKYQPNMT
jgi:hypothetical protein